MVFANCINYCFNTGHYFEYCWWRGLSSDHSFVERLKESEIPDGVLPEYWFVGETRRTAALLEVMFHKRTLELIDGVLGILTLTIAVFGWAYLYNHWDDYRRDALIAKILRTRYEDFKKDMRTNAP